MKRRTLISSALWSSVFAFFAPVRATSVSSPTKLQHDKTVSPHDAVKLVYDGFTSLHPSTEFVFYEPGSFEQEGDYNKVFCKMISAANESHPRHDVWIIFNDAQVSVKGLVVKRRQIIVSQLVTRAVHEVVSKEEYDVKETLRSSWRQSGGCVVSSRHLHYEDPEHVESSFETRPIFRSDSAKKQDFELLALARFLSLVMN